MPGCLPDWKTPCFPGRFIYTVAWSALHSFVWWNNIPLFDHGTVCLFIGCRAYSLASMKNDAMNICVQVFVWIYVFSSPVCIPESGSAGWYANSMFTFWRTVRLFPKVAVLFYILIRNVWKFLFFSYPPTIQLSFLAIEFTTEHTTSRMSQVKKEWTTSWFLHAKSLWCLQRSFAARSKEEHRYWCVVILWFIKLSEYFGCLSNTYFLNLPVIKFSFFLQMYHVMYRLTNFFLISLGV